MVSKNLVIGVGNVESSLRYRMYIMLAIRLLKYIYLTIYEEWTLHFGYLGLLWLHGQFG